MAVLKFKRGSQAQLDAAALAGQLSVGEPYLIDSTKLMIGTSPTTYIEISAPGGSGLSHAQVMSRGALRP